MRAAGRRKIRDIGNFYRSCRPIYGLFAVVFGSGDLKYRPFALEIPLSKPSYPEHQKAKKAVSEIMPFFAVP